MQTTDRKKYTINIANEKEDILLKALVEGAEMARWLSKLNDRA